MGSHDTLGSEIGYTITRRFAVPRDQLFQLWAEPDHLTQWFYPTGFDLVQLASEFQAGGHWSATLQGIEGEHYPMRGEYAGIEPDTRIVMTHRWLSDEGLGQQTKIEVTFQDDVDGSALSFSQSGFADEKHLSSNEAGWSETLDTLAEYIADELSR